MGQRADDIREWRDRVSHDAAEALGKRLDGSGDFPAGTLAQLPAPLSRRCGDVPAMLTVTSALMMSSIKISRANVSA